MKIKLFEGFAKKAKQDSAKLAILFILVSVILKIVLYKESVLTILAVTAKLFYTMIIPGMVIFYRLDKNFMFKLILGFVFVLALTGITSYYLGIIGVHVKYHSYIIPPAIMLIGILIFLKNKEAKQI